MNHKTCTMCEKPKPFNEFYKSAKGKYGRSSICKKCRNEISRKYWINNKEKARERQRKYRINNNEKLLEYQRKYYINNKEKVLERKRKYRTNNKEKIREYQRKHVKELTPRYVLDQLKRASKRAGIKDPIITNQDVAEKTAMMKLRRQIMGFKKTHKKGSVNNEFHSSSNQDAKRFNQAKVKLQKRLGNTRPGPD